MRTIIITALMVVAVTTAGAQEDTWSANFMVPHCRAFLEKGTGAALQRGAGIVEGLSYAMTNLSTDTFLCAEIPAGVTWRMRFAPLCATLKRDRHLMLLPFKDLAFMGLRDAWPCPKPPLSDRRIKN